MELNKNIFLQGELVSLRVLSHTDVEGNYRNWLNNEEVVRYNSHGRFPQTPETLMSYVTAVRSSNTDLVLAVTEKNSGKHVGNISLQSINWVDRNAEIAFLLGELEYRGKGLMFDAGQLMIRHGFAALNLHRIYCGTSSENTAMLKLAEKLGMQQEGVRKEAIFKQDKYTDIIEFGILNRQRK